MGRSRCCRDFSCVLCAEIGEQAAKPGDRRSLNPDTQAPEEARASFGQPSTPAREGEEEK
jgi:hypothetical protein